MSTSPLVLLGKERLFPETDAIGKTNLKYPSPSMVATYLQQAYDRFD